MPRHVLAVLSVLAVWALCACTPEEARQVQAQLVAAELPPPVGSTTTTTAAGPSCCTDEQARWIQHQEDERRAAESHQRTVAAVRARFAQHPLRPIAGCESSRTARPEGEPVWDRYYHDQPNSSVSTASGGLQILNGTWASWVDAYAAEYQGQYARAAHAPDWIQMEVAMRAYDHTGSSPWRSSQGCWG